MSYNQNSEARLRALGLNPRAHLPAEGMTARFVDGVLTWIDPLPEYTGYKRSTHRVMCACPKCGRHMSAARLFQHKCGSKIRNRTRRPNRFDVYGYDDEPIDYDEQDRRAAAEERIYNHFNER